MAPKADPKEAKTDQKTNSDFDKKEKSRIVDFVDPSHAKSLFLGSYGSQDRGPMGAISEFYSDQK